MEIEKHGTGIVDTLTLACGGRVTIRLDDVGMIRDGDLQDIRAWLALMEERYRRIAGVQPPEVERVKVRVLEEERDVPFKKVLARWMKDNELTAITAAELTGVSAYTITKVLKGKCNPRQGTQDAILRVINTPGSRTVEAEQLRIRDHQEAVDFLVGEINRYMRDSGLGDNQFCEEVGVPINAVYNLKRHTDPCLPRVDQLTKLAEKLERVRPHLDALTRYRNMEKANGQGHI